MALETLAAVNAALSQTFEADLIRQYNRLAVAAALILAERGRGRNCAWDVEFSGATADAGAEGSSLGTPDVLMDMFGERVLNAHHKLISTINVDIFNGVGVNSNGIPN